MRSHHYLISVLVLAACTHTDPYHTEDPPLRGPLEERSYRLTYNLGADSGYAWSADGNSIVYTYNGNCIGILLREGGTRRKEMCDTRSAPVPPDFRQEKISALAQGPDGRVIFYQTAFDVPRGLPYGGVLVIADTSAPLDTRQVLLTFPTVVSDSVIHSLTDLEWTGPNTFIALAQRVIDTPIDHLIGIVGMIREPRMIVRGEIANNHATLTKIQGTDRAASWAFGVDGNLLFTRGTWAILAPYDSFFAEFTPLDNTSNPAFFPDSLIWSVPIDGGVPSRFAGASFRLNNIACTSTACAVTAGQLVCPHPTVGQIAVCISERPTGSLYAARWLCDFKCFMGSLPSQLLDRRTGQLRPSPAGFLTGSKVRFSPTRSEFIYIQNGDLFRKEFTPP